MTLLATATHDLGQWLGHDSHFSHRFSRSPFYTGDSPTVYRWYHQHHRVYRLADLLSGVRAMTGQESYAQPRQQFSSGRELINAVRTRREEAERFKALSQDVETELSGTLEAYDPELVQAYRFLHTEPCTLKHMTRLSTSTPRDTYSDWPETPVSDLVHEKVRQAMFRAQKIVDAHFNSVRQAATALNMNHTVLNSALTGSAWPSTLTLARMEVGLGADLWTYHVSN